MIELGENASDENSAQASTAAKSDDCAFFMFCPGQTLEEVYLEQNKKGGSRGTVTIVTLKTMWKTLFFFFLPIVGGKLGF